MGAIGGGIWHGIMTVGHGSSVGSIDEFLPLDFFFLYQSIVERSGSKKKTFTWCISFPARLVNSYLSFRGIVVRPIIFFMTIVNTRQFFFSVE